MPVTLQPHASLLLITLTLSAHPHHHDSEIRRALWLHTKRAVYFTGAGDLLRPMHILCMQVVNSIKIGTSQLCTRSYVASSDRCISCRRTTLGWYQVHASELQGFGRRSARCAPGVHCVNKSKLLRLNLEAPLQAGKVEVSHCQGTLCVPGFEVCHSLLHCCVCRFLKSHHALIMMCFSSEHLSKHHLVQGWLGLLNRLDDFL